MICGNCGNCFEESKIFIHSVFCKGNKIESSGKSSNQGTSICNFSNCYFADNGKQSEQTFDNCRFIG